MPPDRSAAPKQILSDAALLGLSDIALDAHLSYTSGKGLGTVSVDERYYESVLAVVQERNRLRRALAEIVEHEVETPNCPGNCARWCAEAALDLPIDTPEGAARG
jgi:hypothetical protein